MYDMMKLEKAGFEIKQSPWVELQEDLLLEIKNRLLLHSDQVRFHAVCKNWHAVDTKLLLPWVISTNDYLERSFTCKLYEPSSLSDLSKPTFGYEVKVNEYEVHSHPCYSISTIIQKYGWIFCSAKDLRSDRTYLLLFSPFTKRSVKLPHSYWGKPFRNTFSIDPNSPDCVFLLLFDNGKDCKRITIKTFCRKYKQWRIRVLDGPENFEFSGQFPVYIGGIFYFVFPIGKLASYNVDSCEWKVESVISYDIFPKNILKYDIYESFELNGELMVICIGGDDSGFIARFDWFNKAWAPLESLGNHSLFCSKKSFLVSPIRKEERDTGILPNKIHYCGSKYIVYSLESGNLSIFNNKSGIRSWDKIAYASCRNQSNNWFEPPHLVKEKLSWDLWRENNRKKSVLPIVAKQYPDGTDRDVVKESRNIEMEQTGEQPIDEEDDDQLESMRTLDHKRKSRNIARDNNTASIKQYDTSKKRNLRTNI